MNGLELFYGQFMLVLVENNKISGTSPPWEDITLFL